MTVNNDIDDDNKLNTDSHNVCQIQTGLHVFKIAHEMFFRTCTHHVILVAVTRPSPESC